MTRYDDTRAVPADPRVADALASLATLPRFPQCHIDLTAFAVDAGLRGIAGLRRIPLPHDDESTVLLSATLNWIATRLFDLGRHTDALAANGEAIELQRDLAGRAERQLVSPATVGTVIGGR